MNSQLFKTLFGRMSLLESYKEIRIDAVVVILQSHKHNDIMCKPFHLKCLILPIRQKQDCSKDSNQNAE